MKNFILGITLVLSGIILAMVVMTYSSSMTRQSELNDKLSEAAETAVAETMGENQSWDIESGKGQEELIGAFLQNLSAGLDDNSTYKVDILASDAEKGLLKVKVTESHKVATGGKNDYVARCTVIFDQDLKYRAKEKIVFYVPVQDDPATLDNEWLTCNTDTDGTVECKHIIENKYTATEDELNAGLIEGESRHPTCLYKEITLSLGAPLILPDAPAIEGYMFLGWFDEDGKEFTGEGEMEKEMESGGTPQRVYGRFRKN